MEERIHAESLQNAVRVGLGDRMISPGHSRYEETRRVWNGMHDRRPAFVAQCLTAEEVSLVLRYAAASALPVTVRGGGHNVAGTAVADGAVMIDLSLMRGVRVDPGERLAEAQGGCLLRDVDAATTPHGLACPAGVVSHTGLGGLALGGGYGWLARKWGLTCDHITAAEVVLADGSIVEATESRHAPLLWALRGGGGNFGIVTRFTLGLRPVGPVYHRTAVYSLDDAADVLAAYAEFAEKQSTDLHAVGCLKSAGRADWIPRELHGRPALFLTAAWFGDPASGPRETAPLFDAIVPVGTRDQLVTYAELQAMGDHSEPHGNRYYTKSCYLGELPARQLADAAREMCSPLSSLDFEYLRGAISDVPDDDSAFPGRDAPYIFTASAQWTSPEHDAENASWARRSVDRVHEFQYGGVYVNYVQERSDGNPAGIYGDARHRRLAALKQRYDPKNVLRHNQNILPSPQDPS